MRLTTQALAGAVLAAALLPAVSAMAQAPTNLKIGVFDPNKILTDSKLGMKLQEEVNTFRIQKEGELKRKTDDYKKLVDQYKASVESMSPERREEIEADLTNKGRDLERDKRDAEADLQRRRQKAVRDLEEQVAAVIDEFGQRNGYTLILQRDLCAYAIPGIDVSADLVKLIDARAPAAGGRPAAAGK